MERSVLPFEIAQSAILAIGRGYDLCLDLRLKSCKPETGDPCLIELDRVNCREIAVPGGISIPNISTSIKCDKGERIRFRSDVLHFQQMAERFNQEICLSGKIPSGFFNSSFKFSGSWQKDASITKALAFDGWFITLYTIVLAKPQIVLRDHVKRAIPTTWDPLALARFIDKFGTHVIVGVKMGGKDVVHVKQLHTSSLQAVQLQQRLKEKADQKFLDQKVGYGVAAFESDAQDECFQGVQRLRFVESSPSKSTTRMEDVEFMYKRRGGKFGQHLSHSDWLSTIQSEPDVISMSFVPITTLLSGLPGSGFLSHAINLYLRYKPPIQELYQFLEFQLPRQWAPVFGDLPLGPHQREQSTASLRFSFLGPRLFVNTNWVDVGKRPVTGLRLYLEGRRSNRLAIHLQHLSSLPKSLTIEPVMAPPDSSDPSYYEPIQWRSFSHVCTEQIQSEDDTAIVTGAQLHVGRYGMKKVLFLRLRFSKVVNAASLRNPDWAGPPGPESKLGLVSAFFSSRLSVALPKPAPPSPAAVNVNSGVYPVGQPGGQRKGKMTRWVEMGELERGPQDSPGYWTVTGARLIVERGKISLHVKYSLLTVILDDGDQDCSI